MASDQPSDHVGPGGHRQVHRPLAGVLWMLLAAVFFSAAFGVVRHLSDTINTFEQTFFRQLIGAVILLPFVFRNGFEGLKTRQLGTNIIRNTAGYLGIAMSFLAVTLIPMADAIALQFTLPLFTIIFAFVILLERPGPHRWAAMAMGFAGAMVIIRPGFTVFDPGMLVALGAAAAFGLSDTMVRKLARTDGATSIVFYGFILHLPIALPVALMVGWTTPSAEDWPWIIAMGLTSFGAQWSLSKSFMLAEVSLVSPVLFTRLPMVAVIAYIFFGEVPDIWVWIGALIIFASTYYATHRERVHQKRKEAAAAAQAG